jgi:hypothetical protein
MQHVVANDNIICDVIIDYEKKGCFATGLAVQFLNCNNHLQLIVFLHPWMLLDKLYELQKMQPIIYMTMH